MAPSRAWTLAVAALLSGPVCGLRSWATAPFEEDAFEVAAGPGASLPQSDVDVRDLDVRDMGELLRADFVFFEELMSQNMWLPLSFAAGQGLRPMTNGTRFGFLMEWGEVGLYSEEGAGTEPIAWFKALRPFKVRGDFVWAQAVRSMENRRRYPACMAALRQLIGGGVFAQVMPLAGEVDAAETQEVARLLSQGSDVDSDSELVITIIKKSRRCELVVWRFLQVARDEVVDIFMAPEGSTVSECLQRETEQYFNVAKKQRVGEAPSPSGPAAAPTQERFEPSKRRRLDLEGNEEQAGPKRARALTLEDVLPPPPPSAKDANMLELERNLRKAMASEAATVSLPDFESDALLETLDAELWSTEPVLPTELESVTVSSIASPQTPELASFDGLLDMLPGPEELMDSLDNVFDLPLHEERATPGFKLVRHIRERVDRFNLAAGTLALFSPWTPSESRGMKVSSSPWRFWFNITNLAKPYRDVDVFYWWRISKPKVEQLLEVVGKPPYRLCRLTPRHDDDAEALFVCDIDRSRSNLFVERMVKTMSVLGDVGQMVRFEFKPEIYSSPPTVRWRAVLSEKTSIDMLLAPLPHLGPAGLTPCTVEEAAELDVLWHESHGLAASFKPHDVDVPAGDDHSSIELAADDFSHASTIAHELESDPFAFGDALRALVRSARNNASGFSDRFETASLASGQSVTAV